jgi:hypothetical protein
MATKAKSSKKKTPAKAGTKARTTRSASGARASSRSKATGTKASTTKKAAAKKTTAKKATTKKTAAKKKTTAKKAPTKKTTVKKTAAKKTPAKKTTTRKAAAKKAPSKAEARKRAAEQKKKALAKKKAMAEKAAAQRKAAAERRRQAEAKKREQEKRRKEAEKLRAQKAKEREKAKKEAEKARLKAQKEREKARLKAEKDKEAEKARKAAEREAERQRKLEEKEAEKARKAAEREAERARKAAAREAEKARRAAEREAEKARKAAEREAEKRRQAAEREAAKLSPKKRESRRLAMLAEKASERQMLRTDKQAAVRSAMSEKAARAARLAKAKKAEGGADDIIKSLIERGGDQGYITLNDLNKSLPNDMVSAEQLDDVMDLFNKADIEIVDTAETVSGRSSLEGRGDDDNEVSDTPTVPEPRTETREDLDAAYKTNDPVRMYLRKMGSVALLSREDEVNIAKRIEAGEKEVLDVVLKSSLAVKEILTLGKRLNEGKIRIRDVVKEVDEEQEVFDEVAVTEKVNRIMGEIGILDEQNDAMREELLQRKSAPRPRWWKPTCASWCRSPRSTPTAAAVPGPHPGGQHRPDEGRRQVRVQARLQVLDLRDVVDPAGHHPRHRGPGADHPHPGPHDRDDQQAHPHFALPRPGARSRAHARGDRREDGAAARQGPQGAQDRQGADLPRDPDRRRRRLAPRRLHRGQERGLAGRGGDQHEPRRADPPRAGHADPARGEGPAHALRHRREVRPHPRRGGRPGLSKVTRERIRQIEAKALREAASPPA